MVAYLDVAGFKALSLAPAEYVDDIETLEPGWLDAQLESRSRNIDARLRKRYAVPFASPYPEKIKEWLDRIVTVRLFMKRGVDPNDAQFELVRADAELAMEELKEAADSNEGLYDLPLRSDTTASGISKGTPLGYSEASPYVWTDIQAETGRAEDSSREGTGG